MRAFFIVGLATVLGACAPVAVGDDNGGDRGAVSDPGAIAARIAALDGVLDVKSWSGDGAVSVPAGCQLFWISFRQPVDHGERGDTFAQRAVLQHCGEDRPMVFSPDGYGYDLDFFQPEIVSRLQANWLWVEQRYFGPSTPSNDPNGVYLRVRQAADDHHAIVQAFKSIYRARWISTGDSKGGMNAVFHRRYYPDDIDGTVAYVAPLVLDYGDARFPAFIERQGDDACRSRLLAYTRALLSRSDELVAIMPSLGVFADPVTSLRRGAVNYRFYFWQYVGDCNSVPDPTSDASTMLNALLSSSAMRTDDAAAQFASYYAQTKTELGTWADDDAGIDDLVTAPTDPKPDTYSPMTLSDIASWAHSDASRIVFIYGDHDPWSAAAADPDASRDNLLLWATGHGHEADLSMVADDARNAALARLAAWANTSLVEAQSASIDLERKGRLRALTALRALYLKH